MPRPRAARAHPSLEELFGQVSLSGEGEAPKYQQLEQLLRGVITRGVLRPGDSVPTEKELVEYFGVSRVTVRSALHALGVEGLVDRCRGRGTVVNPPKLEVRLSRAGSFTETFESMGFEVRSEVIADHIARAPDEVVREMGLPSGERVWLLERVRSLNGERIAISTHYMRRELRPQTSEPFRGSLYQYLETLGCRPSNWRGSLEAVRAEPPVTGLLQVQTGLPLLHRTGIGLSADGSTVEVSVGFYRGDRYRYSFQG